MQLMMVDDTFVINLLATPCISLMNCAKDNERRFVGGAARQDDLVSKVITANFLKTREPRRSALMFSAKFNVFQS